MDLRQVENILKIAEEKSITRAAEKLFLTQSALNQQLLKLEHELGIELFKRNKINLTPTKAGEIYLAGAKEMLQIKQHTYSRINDLTDNNKGHIVVGLTPGRGPDMFTHVYPIFHKNYPNMIVEPKELSVAKQQPLITNGDLDLGFMTLFDSQRTEDEYIVLYDEEIFIAVPEKFEVNKLAERDTQGRLILPLNALKDEHFILTHKDSTLRKILNQMFRKEQFVPNILFETANNSTIMEMVKTGICCGIVPEYAAKHYHKGIRYYPFAESLRWNIVVSYQKGAFLSKAANLFIQYAKDYWVNVK